MCGKKYYWYDDESGPDYSADGIQNMTYAEMMAQFEDHDQFPADPGPPPLPTVPTRPGFQATAGDVSRSLDIAGVHQPAAQRRFGAPMDLSMPRSRTARPQPGPYQSLAMKHGHGESERAVEPTKYIRDARTRTLKYEVSLGPPMTRRGRVFDTKSIFQHYRGKRPEDSNAHSADNPRLAQAMEKGATPGRLYNELYKEWAASLIWVCFRGPGGVEFFSHVCKMNRFHHSSFTAGADIIGGGQWIVNAGKLEKISANSGHYQPGIQHFQKAVSLMGPALKPETQVLLYDTVEDSWTYVAAGAFVARGGAGGRYKSHPRE